MYLRHRTDTLFCMNWPNQCFCFLDSKHVPTNKNIQSSIFLVIVPSYQAPHSGLSAHIFDLIFSVSKNPVSQPNSSILWILSLSAFNWRCNLILAPFPIVWADLEPFNLTLSAGVPATIIIGSLASKMSVYPKKNRMTLTSFSWTIQTLFDFLSFFYIRKLKIILTRNFLMYYLWSKQNLKAVYRHHYAFFLLFFTDKIKLADFG